MESEAVWTRHNRYRTPQRVGNPDSVLAAIGNDRTAPRAQERVGTRLKPGPIRVMTITGPDMWDDEAGPMRMTLLERWRELAEVENRRARETWGNTGGWYRRPESFGDPKVVAARERRDAQIEAWAAGGMSIREICARVGLTRTSVARILRIRRGEALT